MGMFPKARSAPLFLSFVVLGEALMVGSLNLRTSNLADVPSSQRLVALQSSVVQPQPRRRKLSFVEACEISAAETTENLMRARAEARQKQKKVQKVAGATAPHVWLPQDEIKSLPGKVPAPSSRNMRQFVDNTCTPAGSMFSDYKEMGIENLMVEAKGGTNLMSYYLEVQSNLTSHLGRTPTVDEWACSLNMAAKDLKLGIIKSQEVKTALLERFEGLVRKTALGYRGYGVPFRDLVQEGSCGLIYAAERFDPALGFKFSTYAVHWIRKHVTRSVAQHSRMIRLPQRAHETVVTMRRVRGQMAMEMGRVPTISELAKHPHLAMNVKSARRLVAAARPIKSLDVHARKSALNSEGLELTLGHIVADTTSEGPERAASKTLFRAELAELLAALPDIERDVIEMRFGLQGGTALSYEEVISRVNSARLTTKKDVIAVQNAAMYKLRRPSTIARMSELKEEIYPCL